MNTTWVSLALSIIEAIPAVKRLFEQLSKAYYEAVIEKMKAENAEAIRKAIAENDQRWIEKTMKSSTAGKPSGVPSTEERDSLPGVDP